MQCLQRATQVSRASPNHQPNQKQKTKPTKKTHTKQKLHTRRWCEKNTCRIQNATSEPLTNARFAGTLAFECIAVPASLFMPTSLRWTMVAAAVALHVGIAIFQSAIVGVAFLPNIAPYVFGFMGCANCANDVARVAQQSWTDEGVAWCSALAVCVASAGTVALRGGRLLPEDWPVSPFALFPWSGQVKHEKPKSPPHPPPPLQNSQAKSNIRRPLLCQNGVKIWLETQLASSTCRC